MKKSLLKFLIKAVSLYFSVNGALKALFLKADSSYITKITKHNDLMLGDIYAIFVYYEPNGKFSRSAENILTELKLQKVNVLLVSNCPISEEQNEKISKLVHIAMERENQGFDFGAYKDAILFMKRENYEPNRVLLLNDSVYYFKKSLKYFVSKMLKDGYVTAAFENWEAPHTNHLQSFAVGIDEATFSSSQFSEFWSNYKPVSSRLYAIENGEKKLSKAIIGNFPKIDILYSADNVYNKLKSTIDNDTLLPTMLPKLHRRKIFRNISKNKSASDLAHEIIKKYSSGPFSPAHVGFYINANSCPVVKKDLIYRDVYDFWEVENICREFYCDEQEIEEFLTILRRKGNKYSLSMFNKLKHFAGAL